MTNIRRGTITPATYYATNQSGSHLIQQWERGPRRSKQSINEGVNESVDPSLGQNHKAK
eukprot:CAMPEP_0197233302 /NCGR_PEP_ID=MMETSP1429-20130617/1395_1 /TAXON_ID=49237 /ORGANISM="Chaetoceros  sp., Strain UNC1202" /LENGTH=58 /DNA_ID=CAMNT_0042691521 /DNA_START=81 /DNA_END=257 /DNA_ORIENTATION=+